jgi:uncharacterized protein (TIGR03083 family)
MLRAPEPIMVVDLFPVERRALRDLLDTLAPEDWARPTIAGDWTVKDVAAHLVADDLGRLSGQRDGHDEPRLARPETLKERVDRRNHDWVVATRRLSPRVIRSLLEWSGDETQRFFETLDPFAAGIPVSWAGPGPSPVWLDLARELTERWHHQGQIRDAVGAAILDDPALLRPILETFAFALPETLRDVEPIAGRAALLHVNGQSGGDWTVEADGDRWNLRIGRPERPAAAVTLDEDTAWRMYVRALARDELHRRARIEGDSALATQLLGAFALVS